MKKKIILFFIFMQSIFFINVYAIECHPAYNGNWTVTENCDWPNGYKVYGNIYVGDYIITMGDNDDMGIDLNSNKITFGNGKINLSSTAKISDNVSNRYYVSVTYTENGIGSDCDSGTSGNQCTACPSGMKVFDSDSAPAFNGTTGYVSDTSEPNSGPYDSSNANVRLVNKTGTFYCGTKGT